MNKKSKIILIVGVTSVVAVAAIASFATLKKSQFEEAQSTSVHTLLLDKDNNHFDFKDKPYGRTYSMNVKNYADDDIEFKYRRMSSYASGFAIMNPDSCFYNPFKEDLDNFNGLDGLLSIKVNFESDNGSLKLDFGLDEQYTDTDIELVSGVTYDFGGSYRPSHFRLLGSPGQVIESYTIYITSIEIKYNSYEYYNLTEDSYTTTSLQNNLGKHYFAAGASYTYSLNNTDGYDIGSKNYFIMKYRASSGLKGEISYKNTSNNSNSVEEFYIEPNEEEFRMFLDNFRNGATGQFNKKLMSIKFTNVSDRPATLYLDNVSIANRTYSRTDVKYIQDSSIRLGVSLQHGGSITNVQNMNLGIVEYFNNSYDIKIRQSSRINDTNKKTISSNPNLVNIHDLGREIQQSYYWNVDTENGYTRGEYNGNMINYNPVQAGDQNCKESRIIDYFVTDSVIWVKTQACDWAKDNSLTKSYMTNTYSIKNGLIYVDNSIIDWYGFSNYSLPSTDYASTSQPHYAAQELPAIYTSHSLNYFGSKFGDYIVFDNNSGWNTGGTTPIYQTSSLKQNSDGTYSANADSRSYHYEFRNHPENWLGYFNEDKFGLAVYIPANKYNSDNNSRHVYSAGNLYESHNVSLKGNRTYLKDNYKTATDLGATVFKYDPKESAIVDNCNYLCSTLGFFPPEYDKLTWSYAIGADYMDTLRIKFATIQSTGEIYNDFSSWKGALI